MNKSPTYGKEGVESSSMIATVSPTYLSAMISSLFRVDAVDESVKMNNTKVFNIIVLGGLLKVAPMVDINNIEAGLKKSLPERHHKLIPLNLDALKRGMEIVVQERVAK